MELRIEALKIPMVILFTTIILDSGSAQDSAISTKVYTGHISEFFVYPEMMNMNCRPGSCQFYLKEFDGIIFFISKTDAIKYGLIKENKPSKTTSETIADNNSHTVIISPEDENNYTVVSKGNQVKLNTFQCDDYNNKKFMIVEKCIKITAAPPPKK